MNIEFFDMYYPLQGASCTLDASVKMYAHRLDRIHSEAFSITGGLGVISKAKKSEDKGEH